MSAPHPHGFDKRALAGYLMLTGDIALAAHGIMDMVKAKQEGKPVQGMGTFITGAGWALNGLLLSQYGGEKVEQQTERLEQKLAVFLKQNGVQLDAEALAKATQFEKRGMAKKITDFIATHPTEVLNGVAGILSFGMLNNSLKHWNSHSAVAMTLVAVGSLLGIILPEKSAEQLAALEPPHTFLEKIGRGIQQKPLLVGAGLFAFGNAAMAKEASVEHARTAATGDKQYMLKYIAASTYFAGNAIVGVGSKKAAGTDEERASAKAAILEVAGGMLKRLPTLERERMIEATASYLAQQPELRLSDERKKELVSQLHEVVARAPKGDELTHVQQQEMRRGAQGEISL